MTQTWNNGAVPFTGLKLNVINTASTVSSTLMDLQVGSTSQFAVSRIGTASATGSFSSYASGGSGSPNFWAASNTGSVAFGGSLDAFLSRRGAANLRLGAADAAAPVAQTLSVQSVVAGTTNAAGANFTITGSQSTGTGAAGTIAFQTSSAGAGGTAQNGLATVATIGPNTLSGSQAISLLDMAQTWNTSGTPTAIKLNVTDTASAAASLLLDLQTGGVSRLRIQKDGGIILADVASQFVFGASLATMGRTSGQAIGFGISGTPGAQVNGAGGEFRSISTGSYSFSSHPGNVVAAPADTVITRRGVANLRLGSADVGAITSAVTITIAAPGVVTWSSHGLSTGTPVVFTTTGALPTGITSGTTYYVVVVDANTFQLATSVANAIASTPTVITTSGTQSGTHTGTRYNITQRLSMQSVTGVTDRLGADLVITGSQGTGTGAGGSINFQVAPAGSTGTVQNTLVTALTLDSVGSVRVTRALTVATLPGTPLAGMIARVSDALAPTIGMTVAGGGAAYALVNYNGANWTVIGV
jgi:hypothetical protein